MLNSLYRFYFINGGISDEENGCHIFDVITFFLVGCGKEEAAQKPEQKSEKEPKIVATTVAITEIMDKLDLPLVGIPTSSKKTSGALCRCKGNWVAYGA